MTKYEWETELKKNIHRLPDDEIKRVLDYYGELFEDNIERGKSETRIINEFGNPIDVADKILSEYDGELKEESSTHKDDSVFDEIKDNRTGGETHGDTLSKSETVADTSDKCDNGNKNVGIVSESKGEGEQNEKPQKSGEPVGSGTTVSGERVALFLILNILTGFVFFIGAAVIWIVLGALTVASGAIAVGGVGAAIISVGVMFNGYVGSGLAQFGIGLLCVGGGIVLTVGAVKLMILMCDLTRKCYRGLKNWLMKKKESNA